MRIEDFPDMADPCHFCGQVEATAFWSAPSILVCSECAVTELPKLLADAIKIPDDRRSIGDMQRAWSEAEKSFWRAMTIRLAKRGY